MRLLAGATRRNAKRARRRLQRLCVICPANSMRAGRFDVAGRPRPVTSYNQTLRVRVHAESQVPTCVHPDRVGLEPGGYASDDVPVRALARIRFWLTLSLRG